MVMCAFIMNLGSFEGLKQKLWPKIIFPFNKWQKIVSKINETEISPQQHASTIGINGKNSNIK